MSTETNERTSTEPFVLADTPVHLGLGSTAEPLHGFSWDPSFFAGYAERTASDGDEARLVTMFPMDASWTSWERHPAGAEVVLLVSGHVVLIQEVDGEERRVEVRAGEAIINPPGVWHTADVIEPGDAVFVTAGVGTEHRPR